MGKLRKLQRQIERDPEAWMYQSWWNRTYHPECPAEPRYAIGGWRRGKYGVRFHPSYWTRVYNGGRHLPYPYQRFVSRVLKDLGYNVY